MKSPQDLLFSPHHLWIRPSTDGNWEAGITDYAQDLLGDIVFVDAPAVGSRLQAEKPCGLIESVKTGSDLHALVDGEVTEINQAVIDMPEQINDQPYQAWIFKFKADSNDPAASLLTAQAYDALTDAL
ncbi:MAG: glycine cleavage system protein GcvH [Methylotenera sp.]|nr:glycine cleavage system protein GcvH [Methylotenera sp.]